MSVPRIAVVDADWLEGIVVMAKQAVDQQAALQAELKTIRAREPMTVERIAQELNVNPRTVSNYYKRGLLMRRVGHLICYCTRAEFEEWLATDPVNFHQVK